MKILSELLANAPSARVPKPLIAQSAGSLPPCDGVKTTAADFDGDDRPWLNIPPPPPADFWVDRGIWALALRNTFRQKPTLFTGPTGCGKTELAKYVAAATGRSLYSINMGATTDPRTTLIGTTHSRNGETIFYQSRFVDGIQDPLSLILLDEISRAIHEASHILFPILDSQGYIALDESHPPVRVEKHPNAVLFATANFGEGYSGTREMDRALKDRFLIVELDYPPADIEYQLLVSSAGIDTKEAAALVRIANECRSQWRTGELSSPVSTRMLIDTAALISDGIKKLEATKYGISSFFYDGGGAGSERVKVQQIILRYFGHE